MNGNIFFFMFLFYFKLGMRRVLLNLMRVRFFTSCFRMFVDFSSEWSGAAVSRGLLFVRRQSFGYKDRVSKREPSYSTCTAYAWSFTRQSGGKRSVRSDEGNLIAEKRGCPCLHVFQRNMFLNSQSSESWRAMFDCLFCGYQQAFCNRVNGSGFGPLPGCYILRCYDAWCQYSRFSQW